MHTKSKSWVKAVAFAFLIATPVAVLAQAFNPLTTVAPIAGSVLRQTVANSYAGKATLATGTVTVTFQTPYVSVPMCQATEESSATRFPQISAISATAVTFLSSVTTSNTDVIDWECVGNPN